MIVRADNYRRVKKLAPGWLLLPFPDVYYLIVVDGGQDVGAFCFQPCDQDGRLMHVELGEACRGSRASQAYRAAFDWMFENTDVEILRGRIPADNRLARVMAVHVGGVFEQIDCDGLRCYSVEKRNLYKKAA